MNAYAWTALALVLLPSLVGWYILLRALFRRHLERHEARQAAGIRQINADATAAALLRHRTAFQRKRDLRGLGNARIVRLTRGGPV